MKRKQSELRKLAEFVNELTWDKLPEEVQCAVRYRVLDLVSVALGAAKDPGIQKIADSYEQRSGLGTCHVWGYRKMYPLSVAVLLNGMLAHKLELDDVHPRSKTHGSASLIPAAWGCAEYLNKTGVEFLTAVVAGYEVTARIGMAMGAAEHRARGWHATSTCGVFGCAAACAKLLGLDVEGILSAMGMAGTQSCGVWEFLEDGSTCKILHTGRAAVNGLEAVFLAKAGMTGPEHILEGNDGGLLKAMSNGGDPTRISCNLWTEWEILNMDMKPYPCCRSTHAAIDCALELRKNIRLENIREIQVRTYEVGYRQCAVSDGCCCPKNTQDAKFSLPYTVAAAFLYGNVSMKEFETSVVTSPEIQRFLDHVHVISDRNFTDMYPEHWGCQMDVFMNDGMVYTHKEDDPSGSVKRPLNKAQMMKKAENFLGVIYGEGKKEVAENLLQIDKRTAWWKLI